MVAETLLHHWQKNTLFLCEREYEIARLNSELLRTNLTNQERQALQDNLDAQTSMLNSLGSTSGNGIPFYNIPNLSVSSGSINISGDNLTGSGNLTVRGDSKIEIINHSNVSLLVNNLSVLNGDDKETNRQTVHNLKPSAV